MKILMLSWEYPPRIVGGISRVVYNLAKKISEHNNTVYVVTCRENETKNFENEGNVYVYRVYTYDIHANSFINWAMHLNFSIVEQSIKIINDTGGFDIIHAHDWIVAFAARVLKSIYSIPLVSTIHATEFGRNRGIHNETQKYISNIEWWLTYEAWKVIVNSFHMKTEVKSIFQLPEDKIEVIPNGIDIDKFKGYKKDYNFRRNYARDDEKIIFYVGRIVNEKGVHVLLDAVPKVLEKYNQVKFVIAGKGPQLDYLKNKAKIMNVEPKVYFTGYISEDVLKKLYKCADITVFPSLYEPFGIVALEGMVAEVPVVVSDIGGLKEIVEHGIDGMKFYMGNPNSLADSIMEILKNPEKTEIMKKKAILKVHENYNWDIISRKTEDIYKRILKEKNTNKSK